MVLCRRWRLPVVCVHVVVLRLNRLQRLEASKCLTRYNVLHAARVRIGLVNVCIYLMSGKRFFGTLLTARAIPVQSRFVPDIPSVFGNILNSCRL